MPSLNILTMDVPCDKVSTYNSIMLLCSDDYIWLCMDCFQYNSTEDCITSQNRLWGKYEQQQLSSMNLKRQVCCSHRLGGGEVGKNVMDVLKYATCMQYRIVENVRLSMHFLLSATTSLLANVVAAISK